MCFAAHSVSFYGHSPRQKVYEFYGKHLQVITAVVFIALPIAWTIALYGIIGVLLLFTVPMIFVMAPPLLALIFSDVGALLCHRVLAHKVINKEEYSKSILRTERMLGRLMSLVAVSFLLSLALLAGLGALGMKEAGAAFTWVFAFFFWSYLFSPPLYFRFINSYARMRLCFTVAKQTIEEAKKGKINGEVRKVLPDLVWLESGLQSYNDYLSTLRNRLIIVNLHEYYDVAYSAIMAGTENDTNRIVESLQSMLDAVGRHRNENKFNKFNRALIRIRRNGRVNWEDMRLSFKTESLLERIWRRCKPIALYVVPTIGVVYSIVRELLPSH